MSLGTSPSCTCEATLSQSGSRSSKFLRGLVHRPRVKSLSHTRPENVGSALDAFHNLGPNGQACAKCSPRPQSWDVSTPWKRQGQTPGMDDYLTLAQLEECLDRQAFYIGCIEIPQQITNQSFSKTAEAPSIKDHSTNTRPAQPCQVQSEPRTRSSQLAHQSNSTVIDGVTHPALRESALLPIPSIIVDQDLPLIEPQHESSRLVVPVPSTNWTYGR